MTELKTLKDIPKNYLGGKIKTNNFKSLDELDILILKTMKQNKNIGTLELSKKIGIAPKNLGKRIKKQFELGVIEKDKKSLKPKGWQRVFIVTKKGNLFIKFYEESLKILNKIEKEDE